MKIFAADSDVMSSHAVLGLLQRYACEVCTDGYGSIVEIGAYRGGTTIALAKGAFDAGRGKVTSIDPHRPATGIYGGHFTPEDHRVFVQNLERSGLNEWVDHKCTDSCSAVRDWDSPIDLLWVDGDHSYDGVANDIALWVPYITDNGVLIFDDVEPGSDVEEAIRDNLTFSCFRLVEQVGHVVVFRKEKRPRTLYLCGGLQSSGSTLVSWSFLQRQDLDGVLDMDNSVIQQDFSRVRTNPVWLKMTIGAFRLTELVELFSAQGWIVKPILMKRDLVEIYQSLQKKVYGVDGATGDEPPLYTRIQRYLADLEVARDLDWPIIDYERLVDSPKVELQRVCNALGLDWDDAMMTWPKKIDAIAYAINGNENFHGSRQEHGDMVEAIASFRSQKQRGSSPKLDHRNLMPAAFVRVLESEPHISPELSFTNGLLSPAKYMGTRRHRMERMEQELTESATRLEVVEGQLGRIVDHILFGPMLKMWKRFINHEFPARD